MGRTLGALLAMAGALGCGRSMFYDCRVTISPAALELGTTAPGTSVTKQVTISSESTGACYLSGLTIAAGSDPGFSLASPTLGSFFVQPGSPVSLTVAFDPAAGPPYDRKGTLSFATTDPDRPSVSIPLTGGLPHCSLGVTPAKLDLGTATLGTPTQGQVTLTNDGGVSCDVSGIAIEDGGDPGFSAPGPGSLTVGPGASARIGVAFEAQASAAPFSRSATLAFSTGDPEAPSATVALEAELPRCQLAVSPSTLSFGNVLLNGSASGAVTLSNDGGVACDVTAIALASGTDPDFTLPAAQALDLSVAPGGSARIAVDFTDLSGDTPPLLRQGTLAFETGDPITPSAQVPLSAYVNTVCVEASRWIYTVESNGTFARFDPNTLSFTDVGTLSCPAQGGASPFSMAVDQNAVAWVEYTDGELFQVDTGSAACQATSFVPNQQGVKVFGMSFVFQPTTGQDTLYVAGAGPQWSTSTDLATIAFPSLTLTTIGPVALGGGELAGTGDGELWDFVPSFDSTTGISTMSQLDPATAATLLSWQFPQTAVSGGFATKFYGGSFWVFLGSSIFEIDRATGVLSTAVADSGRDVVGAGVSTCAPVQGP
ncbi:MAG: choice-of-anchor D domain-containing protein [Deltaproteobacteria bacterium]